MDNINDLKKSLDGVEAIFIAKAVKDKKDITEAKKEIVKQLDTLILKSEAELLEKHLTSAMFTKPITEPAKAIAKPAIDVGKKVGSAVGKIGAKIGAGAGKIGRGIADYGKGVGAAAKTGAATWKDPMPKPTATAAPVKIRKPSTSNIAVKTTTPLRGASKTPLPTEAPLKQPPHFDNFKENINPKPVAKKNTPKSIKQEPPTGIKSDFGGTTTATKTSGAPTSSTSKLMEQADKLERQLTQPKPVAKKTPPKPVAKPAPPVEKKPAAVAEVPKITPYQQAQKNIQNKLAAKKTEAITKPTNIQTKPIVPFKHIPETPKINIPTGEIDTKLKTITPPKEATAKPSEELAQQIKKVTSDKGTTM